MRKSLADVSTIGNYHGITIAEMPDPGRNCNHSGQSSDLNWQQICPASVVRCRDCQEFGGLLEGEEYQKFCSFPEFAGYFDPAMMFHRDPASQ